MNKERKKAGLLARRRGKIFLAVFVVSAAALMAIFAIFAQEHRDRVLPKTYFLGEDFSGKTLAEVEEKIASAGISLKGEKIKLARSDDSWEASFEELGWELEQEELVEKIYAPGHGERFLGNLGALFRSLALKREVAIQFSFNEKAADDWIRNVSDEISQPKQEANLLVKRGQVKLIEPKGGKNLDDIQVKKEVLERFTLKREGEISFDLVDDEPIISAKEAEELKDKALELVASAIELAGPGGSITWSPAVLGELIELKKKVVEAGSFLKKEIYGDAYVSFSKEKILASLGRDVEKLNIEPKDARFEIVDGSVRISEPSKEGIVVERGEAADQIIAVLEKGEEKKIDLPSVSESPAISAKDASDIEKLGINELVATAFTSFAGSPANRVANIRTGNKALSGILVAPGEEFSTVRTLGKIDASSGYLQELVIKENRTIPEFGGGLCQVSTTLFRAALNAGLEIVERKNHSYRVSYYEPPLGMDATIYSPKPDLRFVNNTPSYLLIQGRVEGTRHIFDFYGTKDGREVEITDPEVYDVMSPPPTMYIDDASLEPGETKMLERAHPGAKAFFYYRVKKDGKVIIDRKFTSSYVPWPAKYLRGPTGDENGESSEGEGEV